MERTASTDERLDRLTERMEAGFQRLESRLEDRMDAGFERLDRDIGELRDSFRHLNDLILRFGGRIMIALVSVILALVGVIGAIIATN